MVTLVATFALYQYGVLGGGDAKLFAAGALWFGPQAIGAFALGTAFSGGVLCAAILAYRALPLPIASVGSLIALHDRKNGLPYGVAIAAGAAMALTKSPWMAPAFGA